MRAVLDTNVIVSATLIRGGNEDKVLRAWLRGAFELVLSLEILEEIGRVLSYEKLRRFRWMTEAEVVLLLETLARESILVPGTVSVKVSRDPEDDKFLAAAVQARAPYVVTGDKDAGSNPAGATNHYQFRLMPLGFAKWNKETFGAQDDNLRQAGTCSPLASSRADPDRGRRDLAELSF